MTRGRISKHAAAVQEQSENVLSQLGNARVYLRLIKERVHIAATHGQAGILAPALEDIHAADSLIRAAQQAVASARR